MDTFNGMSVRGALFAAIQVMLLQASLTAQQPDSTFLITGIVYNKAFQPLAASHVINLNSRQGDITDSLGMFQIYAHPADTLLILNISFKDTLVTAARIRVHPQIRLRDRYYELEEARIFEWGSTYGDFREAIVQMPNRQTLGESLGLPRQDPGYVPLEMDPGRVKSPAYLISSPLSFFYQNFNRHAKSARKVYWLEKNREDMEQFSRIISAENIAAITGLSGDRLLDFQSFLNDRMECDHRCPELELYTEIHAIWDLYRELESQGY